jgi:inner membrane transporter RhtA
MIIMGPLAAAGIVLIAPWSNNGVDLFRCCICLTAGALWSCLHCVRRKSIQNNEGGEAVAVGMLFTTINSSFGIIGNGFQI